MIGAIISRDAEVRTRIEAALEGTVDVDSVLMIPEYPGTEAIQSLENTAKKYVAFIDFRHDPIRAIALAGEINRSCPSVGTVALNIGASQADLIAVVRAGVCEVLPQPFTNEDVATAVLNVTRKLANGPGVLTDGVVFAFLPAKPGSGASSLAAYSALASARLSARRPLLLDFDLRLGITSFVLKLESAKSIMDAFENCDRMDQTLWDQLISDREGVDVLGSAPGEFGSRVPMENFQSILKWARRSYSAIAVDLPGNGDDFEIATLQQAGTIFLVCGPDLVSLHMARHAIQRLQGLKLLDRVSVVLNRVDKRNALSMRDIESILGLPIRVSVPSDERGICDAVQAGTGIQAKSALGKQIEVIAQIMVGGSSATASLGTPRPRKRFVEFFSVPQAKGLDSWRL